MSTTDSDLLIVGDFADLDTKTPSEQGRFLFLRHPKFPDKFIGLADGTKARIKFLGPDSDKLRAIKRANERRTADEETNGFAVSKGKSEDPITLTAKRLANDIAAMTLEWALPKIDGADLSFSEDAARALYANPQYAWIAEQAAPFVLMRDRFFGSDSAA